MNHRLFRVAVVLMIGIMMLAGCMTRQNTTVVTRDGSGTNEVIFGFTRDVVEQMDDPFADIEQQASDFPDEWQARMEAWEDDTYQGFKVIMHFSDLDMLESQLNEIMGPSAETESGEAGLLEDIAVQQEGDTVTISGRLKQDAASDTEDEMMFGDFKITWSVELPEIEEFSEESIATIDDNRVTWDLPFAPERDYLLEVVGNLAGGSMQQEATPTPEPTSTSEITPTVTATPITTTVLTTDERCFDEVEYCISGRIRQYWEENGGLAVFGFPITPQRPEEIEGTPYEVQWFERNRLELHPENEPPYDVLLGRLGVDVLVEQDIDWREDFEQDTGVESGCVYFSDTGQNVCGDILLSWQSAGLELDGTPGFSQAESLALFGLPVSGPITETLSDGNVYTVQYFERARFELHPENDPPYNVLLGLLGNEIRGEE